MHRGMLPGHAAAGNFASQYVEASEVGSGSSTAERALAVLTIFGQMLSESDRASKRFGNPAAS